VKVQHLWPCLWRSAGCPTLAGQPEDSGLIPGCAKNVLELNRHWPPYVDVLGNKLIYYILYVSALKCNVRYLAPVHHTMKIQRVHNYPPNTRNVNAAASKVAALQAGLRMISALAPKQIISTCLLMHTGAWNGAPSQKSVVCQCTL